MVPQSIRGAIGSSLLRRSSTQGSTGQSTLAQTHARAYESVDEEAEEIEEESERGGTWRESMFGALRIL